MVPLFWRYLSGIDVSVDIGERFDNNFVLIENRLKQQWSACRDK